MTGEDGEPEEVPEPAGAQPAQDGAGAHLPRLVGRSVPSSSSFPFAFLLDAASLRAKDGAISFSPLLNAQGVIFIARDPTRSGQKSSCITREEE